MVENIERLREAEVASWLKHFLAKNGLQGQPVKNIVVDADPCYLGSPFLQEIGPTGTVCFGGLRPNIVCILANSSAERVATFQIKASQFHS